jgi:hypothetical protein
MDSLFFENDKIASGRQPAALVHADQLGGQAVVEQDEQPEPDDVLRNFPPKTDISFSVFLDRQTGQTTRRF